MVLWENASCGELWQFEALAILTRQRPHLLEFLFDPRRPQLNASPERLLEGVRGMSSGDCVLTRRALEIWCEQDNVAFHEVFRLDDENFRQVARALERLA